MGDGIHKAVLRERRACLRIAQEYLRNELAWLATYEKNGPVEMMHNAQGGKNAAWEIADQIKARAKRPRTQKGRKR